MSKEWRPFVAECNRCGNDVEVETTTGRDNWAYDGDPARCVGCGCPGSVNVPGDNEPATIDWHDEPEQDRSRCIRHLVDPLTGGGGEAR